MANLLRDIRFAISTLLRSPGTTTVIIVILALGIGANSAIFSLLNAVVLWPLPVPHPEQLVGLSTTVADNVNGDEPFSLQMFQELTRHEDALSDLFAWSGGSIENLEVDGSHFTAGLATASGDYYKACYLQWFRPGMPHAPKRPPACGRTSDPSTGVPRSWARCCSRPRSRCQSYW
jgi:hypothetical protein